MQARSALFDVYGDHLRARDNQAPVAALVRLLAPIGIRPPAVRTAISRMVTEGWLAPVDLPAGRGYRATSRAISRLDDAARRIYRKDEECWDGTWHLALVAAPDDRTPRQRLRADLTWLGYARMSGAIWVSPFPRRDLAATLARAGASATTAHVRDFDPPDAPISAWDLARLDASYAAWTTTAGTTIAGHLDTHADPDRAAFAARFHLVHEWRKFLFTDPGLPDELLPEDWSGRPARAFFEQEASRLKPGADRFVAHCVGAGRLGA